MEKRPLFTLDMNSKFFDQWYWSKDELIDICKKLDISFAARKNELRRRVIEYLDTGQVTIEILPIESSFNWAHEVLTLDTVITDSVSFGKNFRNFMKQQIGNKFVCSNDFMVWVRNSVGMTLRDAVDFYYKLQQDVEGIYHIDMSDFNVMNAYIDDFLEDQKDKKRSDALKCWGHKKYYKAPQGQVKYDSSDIRFLM